MRERDQTGIGSREEHIPPGTRRTRLAWFVGLWFGGVLTVTAVAYGIQAFLV